MYYALDFDTIDSKLVGFTDITDYWCLDRRTINEYELIYMYKGSIEIRILNKTYLLKAGDYLFIEPGVVHEGKVIIPGKFFYVHINCEVKCVHKKYVIDKLKAYNNRLKIHVAENSFYILPENHDTIFIKNTMNVNEKKEIIKNLFEDALIHRNELTISSMLFINIYVRKIFAFIQQELIVQLQMNDIYLSNGKINPHVKEAVIYIKNNAKKKITASSVATSIGISQQYLNRLFKYIFGCTIIDYINKQKINMAKELIKSSNLSFKEISYKLGLANPYYFSRLFKQKEGITPSKYRSNNSSKCNE